MTAVTEEILLDRIKSGRLIEDSSQATERYIEGLKRTLIVSADTELISAPAYMNATKDFSTPQHQQLHHRHGDSAGRARACAHCLPHAEDLGSTRRNSSTSASPGSSSTPTPSTCRWRASRSSSSPTASTTGPASFC